MIENNGKPITMTTIFEKTSISIGCFICGESVLLTETEEMVARNHSIYKVCDKCKQAIMKMRETIQHEDKGE